jgi:hypothetical protein
MKSLLRLLAVPFALLIFCGASNAQISLGFSAGSVQLVTGSGQILNGTEGYWWLPIINSNVTPSGGSIGSFLVMGYPQDTHGFAAFDLSSLPGPVDSATLRFNNANVAVYAPYLTSMSMAFYDVSTPFATLTQPFGTNPDGVSIYNDLGSGALYGSYDFHQLSRSYPSLDIPLNGAAIDAINADRGGYFSVGATPHAPDSVPEPGMLFPMVLIAALFTYRAHRPGSARRFYGILRG